MNSKLNVNNGLLIDNLNKRLIAWKIDSAFKSHLMSFSHALTNKKKWPDNQQIANINYK